MTENAQRRNPNQRSYHLDEETVALLDGYAHKNALSQSAALRVLIRQVLGGEAVAPINQRSAVADAEAREAFERRLHEPDPEPEPTITLPPDGQETFRVPEKFREKGGRPRPKHEDDDF